MIKSKIDYKRYIEQDRRAIGAQLLHPLIQTNNSMIWLTDSIVRFEKLLRKVEYWENCKTSPIYYLYRLFLRWRFQRQSAHLGFSIPLNVCGPGLCILHYGSIVISRHAKIGDNCVLNSCVNIGVNPSGGGAPVIGDNVYIGPGTKIWNDIHIADNCILGANSCINKDINIAGSVVVGVNKIIS